MLRTQDRSGLVLAVATMACAIFYIGSMTGSEFAVIGQSAASDGCAWAGAPAGGG